MLDYFKEKNIEECANILFDIYKNEPFNYFWLEYNSIVEYVTDIFNTPKFKGFIFCKGEKIVGVCLGVISDYFKIKKYRISEIFIERQFSGKGFGTEFIREIESVLKSENVEAIELTTDKSQRAFDFYIKNNYSIFQNNVNMVKIIK